MTSIKDIFTKDVKPLRTSPLRRPGFCVGLSFVVSQFLSIMTYGFLHKLGLLEVKAPLVLPIALTWIIYNRWRRYAELASEKEGVPEK